jgi:hypothetical protein
MQGSDEMTATNRNRLYYRTTEACRIAGISRSTLLRWFKSGTVKDVTYRDRRGGRLFTQVDIERIRYEADKAIEKVSPLTDISEVQNADDVKVCIIKGEVAVFGPFSDRLVWNN